MLNELSLLIDSSQGSRLSLVDLRASGLPMPISVGETLRVNGSIAQLPYVEGDYAIGLTVNTPEYWENVFDLARLSVTGRVSGNGYTPCAPIYRGTTELEFTASTETLSN